MKPKKVEAVAEEERGGETADGLSALFRFGFVVGDERQGLGEGVEMGRVLGLGHPRRRSRLITLLQCPVREKTVIVWRRM